MLQLIGFLAPFAILPQKLVFQTTIVRDAEQAWDLELSFPLAYDECGLLTWKRKVLISFSPCVPFLFNVVLTGGLWQWQMKDQQHLSAH